MLFNQESSVFLIISRKFPKLCKLIAAIFAVSLIYLSITTQTTKSTDLNTDNANNIASDIKNIALPDQNSSLSSNNNINNSNNNTSENSNTVANNATVINANSYKVNTTTNLSTNNQSLSDATQSNNNKVPTLLPIEPKEKWQQVKVKSGTTLAKIFTGLGIPAKELHTLLAHKEHDKVRHLKNIKPGQVIHFLLSNENNQASNKLKAIKMDVEVTNILNIKSLNNNSYKFDIAKQDIKIIPKYKDAKIADSLFQAGTKAGIDARLLNKMVDIFGWDIDFALDVRKNDKFKILYEEKHVNGKKIGIGNILAAEFVNDGQKYQAILYKGPNGELNYYTPEGSSLQKAFIRTPVKFTRISSKFSQARHHPILHKMRAHKGVDYSAPIGTPVKATGNGKVIFVGIKGGYGKCIVLQHGREYTTVYGHLSNYARHLKPSTVVKQGQIIGYVGMTGLASGPHLHYEFRVNGIHKDPLTVKLPKSDHIPKSALKNFKTVATKLIKSLDNTKSYFAKNES